MAEILLNNIYLTVFLPLWIFLIIMIGRFFSVFVNRKTVYGNYNPVNNDVKFYGIVLALYNNDLRNMNFFHHLFPFAIICTVSTYISCFLSAAEFLRAMSVSISIFKISSRAFSEKCRLLLIAF